jgi:hypothetical protein
VTPPPTVIRKFPSPYNTNNLVYKDKDDKCYKYKHKKVSCNETDKSVVDQPVLENFKDKVK